MARFFEEENIIVGYENGKAIYNPEYICHDPQERLYIDYQWVEGIEPNVGDFQYREQMTRFSEKMKAFRYEKGDDDKFAFDLPIAYSSTNARYRNLNKISMKQWMEQEGLVHKNIVWYINYCCLDDFGQGIDNVSAWAAIHYFTSRKYDLYSQNHEILTWPEGNQFLVKRLEKYVENRQFKNHLVYDLAINSENVVLKVYDKTNNISKEIIAEKVILATPQYINKYLLPNRTSDKFRYAPWIVATITLERFPYSEGASLSWENIIFEGKGLGYVYNQHQNLSHYESPFVITYYRAYDGDLDKNRRKLLTIAETEIEKDVLEDLKTAHPGIEEYIQSIEIYRRGHGMISPSIDFLFSETLVKAAQPIANKVYFAHTDLSGVSLFEEAFYQGTKVTSELLKDE